MPEDNTETLASPTIIKSIHSRLDTLQSAGVSPSQLEELACIRKELERVAMDLSAREADLLRVKEEKMKFLSTVTHELRIPMTSIKGYTDLLVQGMVGEINENQLNFLNVIHNNVERMSALLADLSDINRLDGDRLNLTIISLPTHGYIQEVVTKLTPLAEERGHSFCITAPATLPRVLADPNRFSQILTTLLINAIQYTPEAGEIIISAKEEQNRIEIEVIDFGAGISEEDMKNIFLPFFRSDDPIIRQEPGWGLNLSVAKKLVILMGGEMNVESTYKKGSRFWFSLPAVYE